AGWAQWPEPAVVRKVAGRASVRERRPEGALPSRLRGNRQAQAGQGSFPAGGKGSVNIAVAGTYTAFAALQLSIFLQTPGAGFTLFNQKFTYQADVVRVQAQLQGAGIARIAAQYLGHQIANAAGLRFDGALQDMLGNARGQLNQGLTHFLIHQLDGLGAVLVQGNKFLDVLVDLFLSLGHAGCHSGFIPLSMTAFLTCCQTGGMALVVTGLIALAMAFFLGLAALVLQVAL